MQTANVDPRPSKKRVESIQALRAIAALGVVFYHFQAHNSPAERFYPFYKTILHVAGAFGFFGIALFFVISGFVMVVTSWDSFGGAGASLAFLQRRIVRIYPAYWLALLPVSAVFFINARELMAAHAHEHVNLLASLFLLPSGNDVMLLGVSWTLVWEMIFYIVFALLILLPRGSLLPALFAWAAVEAVLTIACYPSANPYVRYFGELFPVQFIMGAIVGWLYMQRRLPFASGALCAGLAGTLYLWASKLVTALPAPHARIPEILAVALVAMLLVYGAAGLEQRGRLRTPAALVQLGDGSYAMYLWHMQVVVCVGYVMTRAHFTNPLGQALGIAGTLVVLTFVSLGIYRYFERPVNSSINRFLDRAFASPRARALVQVQPADS
jgi:peptidoglycan/LPS O-acetylase OafA/YrhL